MQKQLHPVENFILGGVAAAISKTAVAPFERNHLLVLYQDDNIKSGGVNYFRRIIDGKMLYLWRGNTTNVIKYFPTQALNFMFKEYYKQFFGKSKEQNGYFMWFLGNITAGSAAGVSSIFLFYPLDYARTKLANDARLSNRQFNGLFDVYRKTVASHGIGGLYRGFIFSSAGIIVYRGCYFGLYDSLKPIILSSKYTDNLIFSFCLAYAVTMTSTLVSYPLDTVRRRMMMATGYKVKYSSPLQTAQLILKNEGVYSFFKGAGFNSFRSITGAGVLVGFDKLKELSLKFVHNY